MNARAIPAVLLLLTVVAAPACAQGLVENGDFEDSSPGPGPADFWIPYVIMPSPFASYEVVAGIAYSGVQSQMWYSTLGAPYQGGIFQSVPDLYSDVVYEAPVYFCDPIMMLGPTLFRIGIEQNGLSPQDAGGVDSVERSDAGYARLAAGGG